MTIENPEDTGLDPQKEIFGLSPELWRVGILLGLAQFSIGLWLWQFDVHLNSFLEPWQLGITFALRPLAALAGAYSAGVISDFIGRKAALAISMIPISFGLLIMSTFPVWPFIPLLFGLVMFGTNSVNLMSRAIPADVVEASRSSNPARKFMMIMVPFWFIDGLSPLVGAYMISIGFTSMQLYLIASIGGAIAFVAVLLGVRESLPEKTIEKARGGKKIALRSLGSDFWMLLGSMIAFTFFDTAAISYIGVLCVVEWNVDIITFSIIWSIFSFTAAITMYGASNLADRNVKTGLVVSIFVNGLMFILLSVGSGVIELILINIVWASSYMVLLGSRNTIIACSVPEELKGRAFGTYDLFTGFTAFLAALIGAVLWQITSSLRFVWGITGIGIVAITPLIAIVVRRIHTTS